MAKRYYISFPISVGEIVLQGPEARHLATVMRARPGDAVCLFNGDGNEFPAIIKTVGKREVVLQVQSIEKPQRELGFELEVASAVPKGDREEFLIEKLTEIGVTRFVPLISERSVVIPKTERLRRTVIEASKQCGRNALMEICEVMPWDVYSRAPASARRWLAHPGSQITLPKPGKSQHQCIAVGPEGGFTDLEIELARSNGWECITLGQRILRIETAAIALAAYLSLSASSA